jgi:hypothetical protein
MQKSIKITVIFVILLLTFYSANAQTDDWSVQWDTKFGKVTITKNGTSYTGSFPNGKITEGREQDGMLLGRYTYRSRTKNNLGLKGEYRFILSADKTKFDGYHKSQTDKKWRSENWNGVKVWGTVMPVIVSNNIYTIATPTWTGTWESTTHDIFKILDTGNKRNSITEVFAKISVKVDGTTKNYDVKGFFEHDKPEIFKGTLYGVNGRDAGYMIIEYGALKIDDFTGYMWLGNNSKHTISAHRTSPSKPTVKIF